MEEGVGKGGGLFEEDGIVVGVPIGEVLHCFNFMPKR